MLAGSTLTLICLNLLPAHAEPAALTRASTAAGSSEGTGEHGPGGEPLEGEGADSTPRLENLFGVELHGFISQGAIKSSANNYLGQSKRGTLALSEAGINFTRTLSQDLRAGIQFFARRLGTTGDFSAKFDWFYLDYRWTDWLGLRAGRVKIPFGLYNDVSDIDSARVPILLPQGVYPTSNRDYLLAQTGGELYGEAPLGAVGELAYRLYGGTLVFEETSAAGPFEVKDADTTYMLGGRLSWETPVSGLKLIGSVQRLNIEFSLKAGREIVDPLKASGVLAQDFSGALTARLPATLWIVSLEYIAGELSLAAEYGRWYVDLESTVPALLPEAHTVREQFYLMGAYQVTDWLHPGVYVSSLFPDVRSRKGRGEHQVDLAMTLRFNLTSFWILKVEGHVMIGTAQLSRELNDGLPLDQLTSPWGVGLVKTTLHF